jgi:hypothetical protein
MATRANIYVDQGTDFSTFLNLSTTSGVYDLTTQQFECDVRKVYSSSASLFSPTFVVEPGGANGVVEMVISSEDTANLEPGKYQYDVIMINENSGKEKILEGLMFILPTITRS